MRAARGIAAIVTSLATAAACADTVWVGSQLHRSASAHFDIVDGDLEVTLTNTSTTDALVPSDILTAVFINISGAPTPALTPDRATLAQGSLVHFGGTDGGGGVGGEWAFRAGPILGYNFGISSTGLDIFGPFDRFPGSNLQGPESPDGLQYGITSAGDNVTTGNAPVTGDHALIQNAVVFRLGNLPAGFQLSRIDGVLFQYGTSLSEPSFPGVPAPGTMALLAAAGLIARRRGRG